MECFSLNSTTFDISYSNIFILNISTKKNMDVKKGLQNEWAELSLCSISIHTTQLILSVFCMLQWYFNIVW